ncbi:MAG: trigger factor [Lachnospiraceae bacterium]|nr:trigger factor [Lachnospiraceae bacterium]
MRKYVKLTLCGLAAMMLIAGCSKKEKPEETTTAPAETSTEANQEVVDKGTVKKLGEYKGLELTKTPVDVTDEELEARIQSILEANPEYVEITDRAAKEGDTVDIDFVGMKDGVAFDGGTSEGYKLELGSGSFIPGFEEGLIGAKTGDELSLNLTFPETYGQADLAGQAVVFDVTVNGIEEKKDAVLDDNFVQRTSDFSTVDEYRADTLATMESEKEKQAQRQLMSDAIMAVIETSEFDLNQAAVDQEYESQKQYMTYMSQTLYGMSLEDLMAATGMTDESMKTDSENIVKEQLLIPAIAEKEGLKAEDADRTAVAQDSGMTVDMLKQSYGEEAVEEAALNHRVQQFLLDNAVIK